MTWILCKQLFQPSLILPLLLNPYKCLERQGRTCPTAVQEPKYPRRLQAGLNTLSCTYQRGLTSLVPITEQTHGDMSHSLQEAEPQTQLQRVMLFGGKG